MFEQNIIKEDNIYKNIVINVTIEEEFLFYYLNSANNYIKMKNMIIAFPFCNYIFLKYIYKLSV